MSKTTNKQLYICPNCREIIELPEPKRPCKEPKCGSCGLTLLTIDEELTELMKGKKVLLVAYKPHDLSMDWEIEKFREERETSLKISSGEVFILFEDGTIVRAWNTEWGGIDYMKKYREVW